jgi:hypothetical protein
MAPVGVQMTANARSWRSRDDVGWPLVPREVRVSRASYGAGTAGLPSVVWETAGQ